MVRPINVQMTPVGAGAETAEHLTWDISPGTPSWRSGLVMVGVLLSRMLAGCEVTRS